MCRSRPHATTWSLMEEGDGVEASNVHRFVRSRVERLTDRVKARAFSKGTIEPWY